MRASSDLPLIHADGCVRCSDEIRRHGDAEAIDGIATAAVEKVQILDRALYRVVA